MKAYIGTKIVHAERNDGAKGPGYKVVYEDGYESWSPQSVFERCYRQVTAEEEDLVIGGDHAPRL